MNKDLIKKYKAEFDHWMDDGKLQVKFVNDPWEEAPEDIFSYNAVNFVLVIDDEYVEFRKALAENKTIQHISATTGEWVDFNKGFEPTPSYTFLATPEYYRIKLEKPKFKVGDWVIHNGVTKQVTKAVDGYIDSLDNEVVVIMKEESLELWKPKEKEYFWYKNDLVKFHETQSNAGLLLQSARGCSYHVPTNFEKYCEPFIGQLPSNLK